MFRFVTFSAETVIFSNKKSGAITRSAEYSGLYKDKSIE